MANNQINTKASPTNQKTSSKDSGCLSTISNNQERSFRRNNGLRLVPAVFLPFINVLTEANSENLIENIEKIYYPSMDESDLSEILEILPFIPLKTRDEIVIQAQRLIQPGMKGHQVSYILYTLMRIPPHYLDRFTNYVLSTLYSLDEQEKSECKDYMEFNEKSQNIKIFLLKHDRQKS